MDNKIDINDLSDYQQKVLDTVIQTNEVDKYDLMTLTIMSEYFANKILKNVKPVSYDKNTYSLQDVRKEIILLLENKKITHRNKSKMQLFYEITNTLNLIKVNFFMEKLQNLPPQEKVLAIKSRIEEIKLKRNKNIKNIQRKKN